MNSAICQKGPCTIGTIYKQDYFQNNVFQLHQPHRSNRTTRKTLNLNFTSPITLFPLTLSYSSASGGHLELVAWSVGCSSFQEHSSVSTEHQDDSSWRPRRQSSVTALFSVSEPASLNVVVTWNDRFIEPLKVSC